MIWPNRLRHTYWRKNKVGRVLCLSLLCDTIAVRTKGGAANVSRKEYFIIKQELMDREEEIEEKNSTIKMLEEENQHLKSQLLSAGIVKKEAAAMRIKDEPTMFDPSEYTFLSTAVTIESDPLL